MLAASDLSICLPPPHLIPSRVSPFNLQPLPSLFPDPLEPVEQRLAYEQFLASISQETWNLFLRRHLAISFGILPDEAGALNFDAVFVLLRRLPSHVVMTWVKTISNGWCTSRRMHEQVELKCLFGCQHEADSVLHYLKCKVLRSIAYDALGCDAPSSVSILSALGVLPVCLSQIYIVYVLFTVYHEHKSNISNNIASLAFSGQAHSHSRAVASAAVTKLRGMIPGGIRAAAIPEPETWEEFFAD